ncbi:hypothetical protein ACIQ34_07175 [Ureibacillus sp. NPDC094379]
MRKDKDNHEKNKIDTDDSWNRTFYGSPTVGGMLVVGAIILYVIFNSKW